jgi:hypothetical protein
VRLEKLLLLMDIARYVVLPRFIRQPVTATKSAELVAEIVLDESYRQHLWERAFLHAAADPFTLRDALVPGYAAEEVAARFAPITPSLLMPPAILKRCSSHAVDPDGPIFVPSRNLIRHNSLNEDIYVYKAEDTDEIPTSSRTDRESPVAGGGI